MESDRPSPSSAEDSKPVEPVRAGESRPGVDTPRVEVSAATVTRMMGIASVTDLKLLETRIDLLTSKVTSVVTKVDRVISSLNGAPTASDIDRLEIQLGSVKSMLKEVLESLSEPGAAPNEEKMAAREQSRKLREGIRTNSE